MGSETKIIRLNAVQLREHVDRQITSSVEETLNQLLEAEADGLCSAGRSLDFKIGGFPNLADEGLKETATFLNACNGPLPK